MASAEHTEVKQTLMPNLVLSDCAKAIDFYKKALGAQELARMDAPDGQSVWHAELMIGNSVFFLNDQMPGMGPPAPSPENPSQVTLWLYADDCDASFRRAVDAGAQADMPPQDMFWGDRCASIVDPFGYVWSFAQHLRDVPEDELRRAAQAFAQTMAVQQSEQQPSA